MNTNNDLKDCIVSFLEKDIDIYLYFEFIYDLCELILEFNIEVKYNSFCYKVLKKANSNISFYDIAKTNPKLEVKCICILTIFKKIGVYRNEYVPTYKFYSEISVREYFLLINLKKLGYDLPFCKGAYEINDFLAFVDNSEIVIPTFSARRKQNIIKHWDCLINSDSRFLIALKNDLLHTKELSIDINKLNNVNLLLLDNIL